MPILLDVIFALIVCPIIMWIANKIKPGCLRKGENHDKQI